MSSASPLAPTFVGHIASTQDALILFELCLSGGLNHVARRPHDRERANLIKSGNVFIYEEHSSGIKRWTDGVPWSPSRILGNFLVYRELERPFPPGEKKRAMKRSRRSPGIGKPDHYGSSNSSVSNGYNASSVAASSFDGPGGTSMSKETERSLIGSLVDSYGFKDEGLVKKTVSVTVGAVSHHLVSYYSVADVTSNRLSPPSKDPRFQHVIPRADLVTKQNFRTPIDEIESLDRLDDRASSYGAGYPQYARNGYEMTNQSIANRPLSLPTPHMGYAAQQPAGVYNGYGLNQSPSSYHPLPPSQPHTSFGNQFASPHGLYPVVKNDAYDIGGYRPQQQRYNSVVGLPSDMSRSSISSSGQQFARRASNYEQQNPTPDAGLANMTPSSVDSKLTNDSGYSSSQNYYNSREGDHSPHSHSSQRFLPTPGQQTGYEQAQVHPSYGLASNPETKDNMWHTGNSSNGHGHYLNSHQSWASSGSS